MPLQGTDVARAKQLLDDAGWKPGGDGVRAKGSDRLSFTIISYPGRADLTPYAVSMQSQLKPLGFDIKVMEVQDIGAATKSAMFDAAMKSNNTLPTGNPLYEYNRLLIKGGGDNAGNYTNPQLEDLVTQMRTELDPAKARDLSLKVQSIVKQDVPVVFLTVTPITVAMRKGKVKATCRTRMTRISLMRQSRSRKKRKPGGLEGHMLRYIFTRILGVIPVIFVISLLAFGLDAITPSDPASLLLQAQGVDTITPEAIVQKRVELHLNDSLPVRYLDWLIGAVHGDFGRSFRSYTPVAQMYRERVGNTALLALLAVILGAAVALVSRTGDATADTGMGRDD